jgi:FAD:protein FMN transferase
MIRTLPFRAMGCQMQAALDSDSLQVDRRLSSVPAWFESWEQDLSRFRPDSELNELNRHAGEPREVSLTLWRVFQAAQQAEVRSQGLVTPRILDALVQAGYDRSFTDLAPENEIHQTFHRPVPTDPILFDSATRTICLPPGIGLDFGGVAKGWAAQQAVQKLRAYGPALVDAGGDIAVSGLQRNGSPWAIGVADPFQPEADLATVMLSGGGVATSGIDYRRWQRGGVWQHHIIDPRTGLPAQTDLASVTMIAPSVMEAEIGAKVVLILGSQDGLTWLTGQPGLEGMLILQDRQRITTAGFERYLWRNEP